MTSIVASAQLMASLLTSIGHSTSNRDQFVKAVLELKAFLCPFLFLTLIKLVCQNDPFFARLLLLCRSICFWKCAILKRVTLKSANLILFILHSILYVTPPILFLFMGRLMHFFAMFEMTVFCASQIFLSFVRPGNSKHCGKVVKRLQKRRNVLNFVIFDRD